MNREELEQKLKELKIKYDSEKFEIIKSYCDANNPYKVGDVFTDHMGSVIVEKIKYYYSDFYVGYYCTYLGAVLKKDGKARKNNDKRWAFQSNDIKVKKES